MTALTDIGELSISDSREGGKDYLLRPSFEAMTRIGSPEEIFSLGKEIIDIGLDIPFPEKLKYQLKRQGLEVPENYLTEEGMVNWLWTLLSKK